MERGYQTISKNKLSADIILEQKLDMLTKGLSFKVKGLITVILPFKRTEKRLLLLILLGSWQTVHWIIVKQETLLV